MKSPAFQFYPSDYLASQRVQMMTLEEEGAYIRLLCYCWKEGDIPSDPDQVARLIGKGASTTLATNLLAMFQNSQIAGRMVHERLDQERDKQAKWRDKSSKGGQKSASQRAKNKAVKRDLRVVDQCLPIGINQNPTLLSSSSSSSSLDSSSTKKNKGKPISFATGTIEELRNYAVEIGMTTLDGESMFHHWQSNGWRNGSNPVKNWKSGIQKWKQNGWLPSQKQSASHTSSAARKPTIEDLMGGRKLEISHASNQTRSNDQDPIGHEEPPF